MIYNGWYGMKTKPTNHSNNQPIPFIMANTETATMYIMRAGSNG